MTKCISCYLNKHFNNLCILIPFSLSLKYLIFNARIVYFFHLKVIVNDVRQPSTKVLLYLFKLKYNLPKECSRAYFLFITFLFKYC